MTRLRSGHGPHRATYRQRRSITGHTVPPSGTGRSPITHLSHNEHDLAGWGEAPLDLMGVRRRGGSAREALPIVSARKEGRGDRTVLTAPVARTPGDYLDGRTAGSPALVRRVSTRRHAGSGHAASPAGQVLPGGASPGRCRAVS